MSDNKPGRRKRRGPYVHFTQDLADLICARLMEGESVTEMCEGDDSMPGASSVFQWARDKPEFNLQYEAARRIQFDVMAEKILLIADEPLPTGLADEKRAHIAHRDQKIKSRMWTLEKLDKRFANKQQNEHSGPNGGPIQVADGSLTNAERAAKIAAVFDAVRARHPGPIDELAEDLGTSEGSTD